MIPTLVEPISFNQSLSLFENHQVQSLQAPSYDCEMLLEQINPSIAMTSPEKANSPSLPQHASSAPSNRDRVQTANQQTQEDEPPITKRKRKNNGEEQNIIPTRTSTNEKEVKPSRKRASTTTTSTTVSSSISGKVKSKGIYTSCSERREEERELALAIQHKQNLLNGITGNLTISDCLRQFFMKEIRQTVPVIKEMLPEHKFLLFGEIPLDMDYFVNRMKIRKIDSNGINGRGSIIDRFRPIKRCLTFSNRIEFDLETSHRGLSDFQYIIDALLSMRNPVAAKFAFELQAYQNQVKLIVQANTIMKQKQHESHAEQNIRLQNSLRSASEILDSLHPEKEIFIYNIITKEADGLVTIKKGFSKGLIESLGVTEAEFIRAVQDNKVYHTVAEDVNQMRVMLASTKIEENPYAQLRACEVRKRLHPNMSNHISMQFQYVLRNLVREAISKKEVLSDFLKQKEIQKTHLLASSAAAAASVSVSPQLLDDNTVIKQKLEETTTQSLLNEQKEITAGGSPATNVVEQTLTNFSSFHIPNPLPTFSQYQKFIKNINLHPQKYRFSPQQQIDLFQSIAKILMKKNKSLDIDNIINSFKQEELNGVVGGDLPQFMQYILRDSKNMSVNGFISNKQQQGFLLNSIQKFPNDIEELNYDRLCPNSELSLKEDNLFEGTFRNQAKLHKHIRDVFGESENSDRLIRSEEAMVPSFQSNNSLSQQEFENQQMQQSSSISEDVPSDNKMNSIGNKEEKQVKIKDFYEQLLQFIGSEDDYEEGEEHEESDIFRFLQINSTFKQEIIREYEKIRCLLEDNVYLSQEEFSEMIVDIQKQPKIKKKQYLKQLLRIPDFEDYTKKEQRKREERLQRKEEQKLLKQQSFSLLPPPITPTFASHHIPDNSGYETSTGQAFFPNQNSNFSAGEAAAAAAAIKNGDAGSSWNYCMQKQLNFNQQEQKMENDSNNSDGRIPENGGKSSNSNNTKLYKRKDEVIKKIYDLSKKATEEAGESTAAAYCFQPNDFLEVFYIQKSKLWKNFSKDFVLNNSFGDIQKSIIDLKENQLLSRYYPDLLENHVKSTAASLNSQQQQFNEKANDNSHGSQSCVVAQVEIDRATKITIDQDLLEKIIRQFKMGPPHPFKILLTLKKSLQKIFHDVPPNSISQPFLKNVLKMIVFLLQGDTENYIQCRQRVPLDMIEEIDRKVIKKLSSIPLI